MLWYILCENLLLPIENKKAKLRLAIKGNFLYLLYLKNKLNKHMIGATFKHYKIVDL